MIKIVQICSKIKMEMKVIFCRESIFLCLEKMYQFGPHQLKGNLLWQCVLLSQHFYVATFKIFVSINIH